MTPGDHYKFGQAVKRMVRAWGKRVADADPEDLAELLELHETVEDALTVAITGMRLRGYSWAMIARGLGTSRQYAHKRFGYVDHVLAGRVKV